MDWGKLREALAAAGAEPKEVSESTTEPTKSKVFDSYNTAEEPEGGQSVRKRNRAVDKDKLEMTKECLECEKRIKDVKKAVPCNCKLALFCSNTCLEMSDHFAGCKGITFQDPPSRDFNASEISLLMKLKSLREGDPEELRRLAEAGNPEAAYLIGCYHSMRTESPLEAGGNRSSSLPPKEKSLAETEEEAIKWFLIAAKGGLPDGMRSVGDKLWGDKGLKTDRRVAFYWMAKAWQTGEVGEHCWQVLEEKGMLAIDIRALFLALEENAPRYAAAGMRFPISGPNLGALLLAARYDQLRRWGAETPLGSPLFGSSWLSKIFSVIDACGVAVTFNCGRVGSHQQTTKKILSRERFVTNLRFCQGGKDDSCMDLEQVNLYVDHSDLAKQRSVYGVHCVHLNPGPFPVGNCLDCREEGRQRSLAVAQGLYSISLTEAIPCYGYSARYTTEQGKIVAEVFKSYSKPEICCVLQCLSSNPADLHPVFIAEKQNIYWPLIWYFGTVYDAILECCGEKLVKKVFGKLRNCRSSNLSASNLPSAAPSPDVLAAFPLSAVGELRIACGNENCPKLDHAEKFKVCTGCRVRRFCSEECLRKDWGKHRSECKRMQRKPEEGSSCQVSEVD